MNTIIDKFNSFMDDYIDGKCTRIHILTVLYPEEYEATMQLLENALLGFFLANDEVDFNRFIIRDINDIFVLRINVMDRMSSWFLCERVFYVI